MLWIAAQDTMTSNVASGNGMARMSAVCTSNAIGDALQLRVTERRLAGVPAQILRVPDVDTTRPSGGEAARRAKQHQPATASDIEHTFSPRLLDQVQHPLALAHLPHPAACARQ